MSTKKRSVFQKLKDPPSVERGIRKPLYHGKDGNCIYMVVEDGSAILQYDLDQQNVIKIFTKPQSLHDLVFSYRSHCIDRDNDVIYIMGGFQCTFTSIDLNSGKWCVFHDKFEILNNRNCHYIGLPLNELHTFSLDHYKFDKSKNRLVKLKNDTSLFNDESLLSLFNDEWGFYASYCIYRKSVGQLMMFPEDEPILVCDINNKNKTVSDWRKYEKEPPCVATENILAWDQILFRFDIIASGDVKEWKIWCLDLENNDKWYQSPNELPNLKYAMRYSLYAIKDDYNNVHLMCFKKDRNVHFKASLYDLVSQEIIEINKKRYDPLVIGYVKQFEKRNKPMFIPLYLKKLVLEFYPLFL